MPFVDVAIVGGGIIGLSVAYGLVSLRPSVRVVVLEKEERLAVHQSGRNSGVLHTGAYYRPGSNKAAMAVAGRRAMIAFCDEHGVRFEICGKVIVAVDEAERPTLLALAERAAANDVRAELVGPERLRELEPHAAGVAALHLRDAGIVDFPGVCRALAVELERAGVEIRRSCEVVGMSERASAVVAETAGAPVVARVVVNCAGLQSDRVAAMSPARDGRVRILPFRGEYFELGPARRHLVRNLIYPVPDPRFPFLGVHLTRAVDGSVHAGPNAVLALDREGYSWGVVDLRELRTLLAYPGFRRLVRRHWRTGLREIGRSLSKSAFLGAVRRLVPDIARGDLIAAPSGVRAQAVARDGALIDDFLIAASGRVVNVLNAPSPAATASLAIGEEIASRVLALL